MNHLWTDANKEVVRAFYPSGGAQAVKIVLPERSITAINKQAHRMRVSFLTLVGKPRLKREPIPEPSGTPLPFQDTAADHRAWQETKVPAYVTGNLGWRIAA